MYVQTFVNRSFFLTKNIIITKKITHPVKYYFLMKTLSKGSSIELTILTFENLKVKIDHIKGYLINYNKKFVRLKLKNNIIYKIPFRSPKLLWIKHII
uniref:Uncharacterized protein n=1 Tax=Nephromyces sp. ex Molgula occidentalis TaxID=2544991 RepID=A0A5C1H9M6_9APIC|nr:hypothetical protein [Nephromyces sp. ex Molgula occidentalis]